MAETACLLDNDDTILASQRSGSQDKCDRSRPSACVWRQMQLYIGAEASSVRTRRRRTAEDLRQAAG